MTAWGEQTLHGHRNTVERAFGKLRQLRAGAGSARLLDGVTAVDVENVAGDVRRLVGGEEDDRVGNLFRAAEAAHRNLGHQRCLVLRRARETR